ncbi:MAG: hypothetical protein ACK5XO_02910 [Phycisphaerales bacterium]
MRVPQKPIAAHRRQRERESMKTSIAIGALALVAVAGSAQASMTLTSAPFPFPPASSGLFNAVGTFNLGNDKARLSAAGQSDLQGGNPGNGWWGPNDGSGGLQRSWEVIWNNTAGTITFNVFANNDYTGLAMSMTQTPVFTVGNTLVGLDIGANMSGVAGRSFQYTNVEFNDGGGFVSVPGANALYNGVPNTNNYFALSGTLGDFTLRGQAQFLSGSVTSDGMRFFINGRQAIPTPGAAAVLGLGGLLAARRRR